MVETRAELNRLVNRYPVLANTVDDINSAFELLLSTVKRDGLILTCGNGGSAADSEHIVGELMKGFYSERPLDGSVKDKFSTAFGAEGEHIASHLQQAIRSVSLVSQSSLITAFINDSIPELVYAQQVWGYGRHGDSLLCISTSGNSKNVVYAAQAAKVCGMNVIGLTGEGGGSLADICDVTIKAPSKITADIQELHLPIYHCLCLMLESEIFG